MRMTVEAADYITLQLKPTRRLIMNNSTVIGLATVALLLCPAIAIGAGKAPDLKGKWVGRTYSIVAGSGGHWPTSKGTFEKPGLYEKDLVIEVKGQEDRRFWGLQTISGNGEKTEEPFIGELAGKDNHDVLIADTDGYLKGEINGDALSFCYAHAGGKSESSVVSCTTIKRAR
jgi:hypothetical protein